MLAKIWTAAKGYKVFVLAGLTILTGILGAWHGDLNPDQAAGVVVGGLTAAGLRDGINTSVGKAVNLIVPLLLQSLQKVPEPPALVAITPELKGVQDAISGALAANHTPATIQAVIASSLPAPIPLTAPAAIAPLPQPSQVAGLGSAPVTVFLVLLMALSITACTATSQVVLPQTPLQRLFVAEGAWTDARTVANTYEALPVATAPLKTAIENGLAVSQGSLLAAEMDLLGCSLADYVASTSTPPTKSCGTPLTGMSSAALTILDVAEKTVTAARGMVPAS